jgi:hypothetical protein
MGKGGCLFAFAAWGVGTIRKALGCMCFLLLCGPILILIGATMLFGGNYRDGNIAQYNAAVANFTATGRGIVDQSTVTVTNGYTVGSVPMQKQGGIAVTVQGNTDGVTNPTYTNDLYFEISLNPSYTQTFTAQYASGPSTVLVVSPPQLSSPKSTSVSCDTSSGCSSSTMQSKCTNAAPSSCASRASIIGYASCSGKCTLTCSWTEDLVDVCRVMKFSGEQWQPDPSKTYCRYPFTRLTYGVCFSSTSSSLPYRIRSSDDPFVVLQALTSGTNDFGLTEAQQRLIGIALIIGGGLILSGLVALCICARSICTNETHRVAVWSAFGRGPAMVVGTGPGYQPVNQMAVPMTTVHQPLSPQYNPQYPGAPYPGSSPGPMYAAPPVASPYGAPVYPHGSPAAGVPNPVTSPMGQVTYPAPGYGYPPATPSGQPGLHAL